MISTNTLSIYNLQHDQNEICEQNLRSIQYIMHSEDPARSKFKRVCTEFPILAVLTKSATPGDIQVTYAYASVGNKSLSKTVTAFDLEGYLETPTLVWIDIKRTFAGNGEKIRLPMIEVFLHAAAGELAKLNKLRDWTSINAVLLPPFLTETVLTNVETSVEALLNIFSKRINKQEA